MKVDIPRSLDLKLCRLADLTGQTPEALFQGLVTLALCDYGWLEEVDEPTAPVFQEAVQGCFDLTGIWGDPIQHKLQRIKVMRELVPDMTLKEALAAVNGLEQGMHYRVLGTVTHRIRNLIAPLFTYAS